MKSSSITDRQTYTQTRGQMRPNALPRRIRGWSKVQQLISLFFSGRNRRHYPHFIYKRGYSVNGNCALTHEVVDRRSRVMGTEG